MLKFDDDNFTGWDLINNQLGFSSVLVRCSFDDENGDVRTVQGYVIIEKSALTFAPGQLVKNDFTLQGNGKLDIFDGLIPCPTVISTITVDGQEDEDGVVRVNYTYTGDIYQVKYLVDNAGVYGYALAGATIDVTGLSVGDHTISVTPLCVNGYEGTGADQAFVVTQGMTCASTISGLTVNAPSVGQVTNPGTGVTIVTGVSPLSLQAAISGGATKFLLAIDLSNEVLYAAGSTVPITGLDVGNHTVYVTPICTYSGGQQVRGTQSVFTFTVAVNPSQSTINYNYINFPPSNSLLIYVNGILTVSLNTANSSGSFVAAVGAVVKAVLQTMTTPAGARTATLTVTDTTISSTLFNESGNSPFTLTFSFTAAGDTYQITGEVSP